MSDAGAPLIDLSAAFAPRLTVCESSSSRPLSARLSTETANAHSEVERRLRLPDSISSLAQYKDLLIRFYQLYRPLESLFQGFSEWLAIGMDGPEGVFSKRLAADLDVLGVDVGGILDAPEYFLPPLPTFSSALGALYVIEGSALGSQVILPGLQSVLGAQIAGADTFFQGRGQLTRLFWRQFRDALDRYGILHPEQSAIVIQCAGATFSAIGEWIAP
jgi:heme oxygenase